LDPRSRTRGWSTAAVIREAALTVEQFLELLHN